VKTRQSKAKQNIKNKFIKAKCGRERRLERESNRGVECGDNKLHA
jgi:hypothetical protein